MAKKKARLTQEQWEAIQNQTIAAIKEFGRLATMILGAPQLVWHEDTGSDGSRFEWATFTFRVMGLSYYHPVNCYVTPLEGKWTPGGLLGAKLTIMLWVDENQETEILHAHFGSVEDAKRAAGQFAGRMMQGFKAVDRLSMASRYPGINVEEAESM